MNPDILSLHAARVGGDAAYDPARDLLLAAATPNPIHTRIVTGHAHRIRDSLAYVLALWELHRSGDETVDGEARTARAARVLDAVIALQDTDPASDTYGLWSYWAEEPLSEMVPPDWNWADFLGEFLALILFRHGEALEPGLRDRARAALGHAAASIIRRNVDLDYTNIAVKGAFVTLAAGEILGDAEVREYGRARLHRLHASLTATRSFAEYNSPTYWHVVMAAFTGIRQYIDDPALATLAGDLERVAWEHFLARWHAATGQLTGPMARCYATDLHRRPGPLLVVQRVAADTWSFFDTDSLPPDVQAAHDAVLDFRIPDDLRPLLDAPAATQSVREVFVDTHYIPGQVAGVSAVAAEGHDAVVVPTIGTSWQDGTVTLGSVNFGDTWVQRRPLVGYWAEPGDEPADVAAVARYVSVEVLRDGHGFAGGSFSAAQDRGEVLWSFATACPSGDAHIHLDAIRPGDAVPTTTLTVRFSVRGLDAAEVLVDGRPLGTAAVDAARRVDIRTPTIGVEWMLAAAAFDGEERAARVTAVGGGIDIDIPWLDSEEPRDIVFSDLAETFAAGLLRLRAAGPSVDADLDCAHDGDTMLLRRRTTGADDLSLRAPRTPGSRLDHARIAARNLP